MPVRDMAALVQLKSKPRPQHPFGHQKPVFRRDCEAAQSSFETLPVEIVNQILSYLTYPRSRLPGLTQAQSAHDFPKAERRAIKEQEDLAEPPDTGRWAEDLFRWKELRHPFHTLSETSRRCNALVESFCAHKVRICNRFNLPFTRLDALGPDAFYPNLSGIVYRRLWLQHAPRNCVFCERLMSNYPFPKVLGLLAACEDCFYRQTLTLDEVEKQYHLSPDVILKSDHVRGKEGCVWVLRIDVEALALQLYGTRAFHAAHPKQLGKPCSLCSITKFNPEKKTRRWPTAQRRPRRIPRH